MKRQSMLSKDEIENINNFDIPALLEATRQVELSLSDSLATKDSLDKKTLSLLTVFISFATLTLGISGSHLIWNVSLIPIIIFSGTGICFVLASIFLLVSLWCNDYGALGRFPDTFLIKEYVTGENSYYGYILTIILLQYRERIDVSDKLNAKRAGLINKAIICGIAAPALAFLVIVILVIIKYNTISTAFKTTLLGQ